MTIMKRGNRKVLLIILAFCLLLPIAGMAAGKDDCKNELCEDVDGVSITAQSTLTVTVDKAIILRINKDINKFEIDKKDIVDVEILSPKKLYLKGKNQGDASLRLYEKGNPYPFTIYHVEVTTDLAALKDDLNKIFPNEKDIKIVKSGDSIILSGTVSNAATLSQVLALVGSYAPSGKDKQKLVNLLEVGGVQQVMLEVRISEMSKTLGRKLGINFNAIGRLGGSGSISYLSGNMNTNNRGYGIQSDGAVYQLPATDSILASLDNSLVNATNILGKLSLIGIAGDVTWTALIDAMKERGLVKVLAEPTLITMTGKKANFLAGGEFPIPVPQSGSYAITIDYKTFGVGLNFTPTVLGNGRISMEVAPEVSDLDFTNALYISGYYVPGLTVRRVSTTVELADGQSFAVAGLLKDDVREAVKKIPLLGDIPILGVLFRSSEFQKSETELVIIVTPHLVKPVDMAKQTLPTDQFVEPNDLEFYVLGREEGLFGGRTNTRASSQPSVSGGGGLDGDFGHIIP
jgi:pilus assembly protein CpaC